MNLVYIYEKYNSLNKEYIAFIDKLVNTDLNTVNSEEVLEKLKSYERKFEDLKIKSDVELQDENDDDNVKDFKYLLMDTLFINFDLVNFFNVKAYERFKMRAVNYINKRRRSEMFQ